MWRANEANAKKCLSSHEFNDRLDQVEKSQLGCQEDRTRYREYYCSSPERQGYVRDSARDYFTRDKTPDWADHSYSEGTFRKVDYDRTLERTPRRIEFEGDRDRSSRYHDQSRKHADPADQGWFPREAHAMAQGRMKPDCAINYRYSPRHQDYDYAETGNLFKGPPHSVSQLGQAKKNLKAPIYNGDSSFRDFLVQFELIAQLAQWDVCTMALELAACLRGPAVAVLSDLHERIHYPTLVRPLQDRFEPENQAQLYKAQLKSRIRRSGEGIPELAQDINRLVRNAFVELPSTLREGIAKDAFIESLNNREIELAVFQGRPKILQQAVNIAIEYEAFQATRQKRNVAIVENVLSLIP